jgi:hypothetical protein
MLKFSRRRVNLRTLWHLRKRAWVSLDNHWTRYDSICINDLQKNRVLRGFLVTFDGKWRRGWDSKLPFTVFRM